jgi:hypothetical protein
MAYTYKDVEAKIPNTTMKVRLLNGKERTYCIAPVDGYVIHDNTLDTVDIDEKTQEETVILGFRNDEASVSVKYDFTTTEVKDSDGNTFVAYGDRQFFCKPIKE